MPAGQPLEVGENPPFDPSCPYLLLFFFVCFVFFVIFVFGFLLLRAN
jgi:hypothetical protein